MLQIWKDVRDYEGLYKVSNFGNVKSLNYRHTGKEQLLKQVKDQDGYFKVKLFKHGQKPKMCTVHRLVFESFYRRLLPNEDCHHLNQEKSCNVSTNLVAKDDSLHEREHMLGNVYGKGKTHTQQWKKMMSEKFKGRVFSQQWKRKISEAKRKKSNQN